MNSLPDIARSIDHTLLSACATAGDVREMCVQAGRFGFFSVCVPPRYVQTAKDVLADEGFQGNAYTVRISTVIGFPLGFSSSRVKIYEAMNALCSGADELDIVINLGNCKTGKWGAVREEIENLVAATPDAVHKIIIETCYLTDSEKLKASECAVQAGAEFIKTSTGFGSGGAVLEDVRLIRKVTDGKAGIKASGGIRTLEQAVSFIQAGASRIGTSSGPAILDELQHLDKSLKS